MTARGKLIRNGIIAVVSVAVLAGGYYFAVKWEPEEKEEKKIIAAESNKLINLFTAETEEMKSVCIKNDKVTYRLVQGDNEEISIAERPGIEFDEMDLRSVFSTFSTINAVEVITKDMSRVAEFGLNNKDKFVQITMKDGSSRTFIIGDSLPGSDEYYFMEEGGDAIYTLQSHKIATFMKTPNDFRETALFALTETTVDEISLSKGGQPLFGIRKREKDEKVYNSTNATWVMVEPYNGEGVIDDKIEELLTPFTSVEILDFAEDNPKDLSRYGLGTEGYSMTIKDGEISHIIEIGKPATEMEGVYIRYNGENSVYIGDIALYNAVADLDPMYFVSKLVYIVNIEDIKKVEVEKDGKVYTMEIGDDESPDKYKINGVSAKEESFKKIYQQVIGIAFVDFGNFVPKNRFMTVTYTMKDGRVVPVKLYEYDERYYIAERDNGQKMMVPKTTLEGLFFTLDNAN